MPHFGRYHDDGAYFVSAKSLAEGQGYLLLSFPGAPAQTKYPPLFPCILSTIWKVNPAFPANLTLGIALSWAMLPLFLVSLLLWLRSWDLTLIDRFAIAACLCFNPMVVYLSISFLSELPFTAALLGSFALVRGNSGRRAFAAGVVGAAAFLIRSAALPLVVTTPLWCLWRRRPQQAALFVAAMLPVVIGWMLWANLNMTPSRDAASLYYLNYWGYFLDDLRLRDLLPMLWKNAIWLFHGIGELAGVPGGSPPGRILLIALGLLATAATIRTSVQRGLLPEHLFAAVYGLMLLLWHYPPILRLSLPIAPLIVVSSWYQVRRLADSSFPKSPRRQFYANACRGAVLIALCYGFAANLHSSLIEMAERFRSYRAWNRSESAAYEWISHNLPQDARFLAYNDAKLFLATGRQALSRPFSNKPYYRDDYRSFLEQSRDLTAFARSMKLDYVFIGADDYGHELQESERAALMSTLAERRTIFQSGTTAIIEVREDPAARWLRDGE